MNRLTLVLTVVFLLIIGGVVIMAKPDHYGLSWPSASSPGQPVSRAADTRPAPTPDTTTPTTTTDSAAATPPSAEPVQRTPVRVMPRQFHNDPFLRGMRSPQELAQTIETNLAADPSGHTMLNPGRCEEDGSCATPADYLAMFQQNDPEAGLTSVAELPAFLRSLVQQTAEPGEYWMACLKGNDHTPTMHCMHRSFSAGESVWVDPRSNRFVLAQNCTNPVERPVVLPPCMEIMVTIRHEDSMKFAHLGPRPGPQQCLSLRKVGASGTIELAQYHGTCDFTDAARFFGEPVQEEYCVPVTAGTYILSVSRTPYGERGTRDWWVFCWGREDVSSNTMRVRDFDFIGNAIRRAIIYNSRGDMMSHTWRNSPSHLWIPWGEEPGTDH